MIIDNNNNTNTNTTNNINDNLLIQRITTILLDAHGFEDGIEEKDLPTIGYKCVVGLALNFKIDVRDFSRTDRFIVVHTGDFAARLKD